MAKAPTRDIAAEVMALMNEQFDKGVVPWHKPWQCAGLPVNISSSRPYRGVNVFLLQMAQSMRGWPSPVFGTYHQMKLASGYRYDKQNGARGQYVWPFLPNTQARTLRRDEDGKAVYDERFTVAETLPGGDIVDTDGNRHILGSFADPGFGVKSGEKGNLVIFWKRIAYDAKDASGAVIYDGNGDAVERATMLLRHYTVFNVDQCDLPEGAFDFQPVDPLAFESVGEAERILEEFHTRHDGPPTIFGGDRAFYMPSLDEIHLPEREQFDSSPAFYCTAFHEAIHATGHPKRLNRFGEQDDIGAQTYSREELTAEMGAAMLMSWCGILYEREVENSAAYIAAWRKQCVEDSRLIISAAAKAQRAMDAVLGTTWEDEQ